MLTAELDALPQDAAREVVTVWAHVPAWVDALVAGRPYGDVEQLAAAADALARTWGPAEVDQAMVAHPRIGERPTGEGADAAASRREQAAMADADDQVAAAIAAGNRAYEERFGRVFLIRAAGRTPAEILEHLTRRLGQDRAAEDAETADQLRQIALLRLRQTVQDAVPAEAGA